MRQWTGSAMDQIMTCRLDDAKPSSEPMLTYCQLDSIFQWNFICNSNIFIQENAFKHVVCEMAAILLRGRWVNGLSPFWCQPGHHLIKCWLTVKWSSGVENLMKFSLIYKTLQSRKYIWKCLLQNVAHFLQGVSMSTVSLNNLLQNDIHPKFAILPFSHCSAVRPFLSHPEP